MGFFDDLKKEAAARKAKREAELSTTQLQLSEIQAVIKPKMRELFQHMKEFKETLEELKPDLSMDYEVAGVGKFTRLKQGDYRIWTDPGDEVENFTFQYAYQKDAHFELHPKTKVDAKLLRDYLWGHGLRFDWADTGSGASSIKLSAYVPVSYQFKADYDYYAIRLRIKNLGSLGAVTNRLSPDQFDMELLEELGKMVLHEPNRFDELTGNTITNTQRMAIRKQLEEAERVRKLALSESPHEKAGSGNLGQMIRKRIFKKN